ncbi:MAG: farnesyl-diphosphate farnesyltransferase [Gammaproteobacteria bacterium]|jgi:farnesyl-diphosphate farnesyltransferase
MGQSLERAELDAPKPNSHAENPSASEGLGAPETLDDRVYQREVLPRVSRTFALTIPQLPPRLADVVSNAYLLCRIADTIEDDPTLNTTLKLEFSERFIAVVAGQSPATTFATDLTPRLGRDIPQFERELVAQTAKVVRLTHSYRDTEQAALVRCVRIMAEGMAEFQLKATANGLNDLAHMDRYCYHVAGVVGELLTVLFCEHSPGIAAQRGRLESLAVSFGQGLQMTNILRDIWDDLDRGACWLPRDHFAQFGFDLDDLRPDAAQSQRAFHEAVRALVNIAHSHLRDALDYTLLIPRDEAGIRRFCLWALGMAVLTLRKVHAHPDFTDAKDVKIARSSVKATVLVTSALVQRDRTLRALFKLASLGLDSTVARRSPSAL